MRELKLGAFLFSLSRYASHPSRVRELKLVLSGDDTIELSVAPLAGA